MGKELLSAYPLVLENIRKLDSTLQRLPDRPSRSIEEEPLATESATEDDMSAKNGTTRFDKAEFAQPLCTVV
jgi:hypothetical protein